MLNRNTIFVFFLFFLNFSLSKAQTPINDDCSGAIVLPVTDYLTKNDTIAGSITTEATSSYSPCTQYYYRNVWYKFVAQSTRQYLYFNVKGSNLYAMRNGAYKGTDCDNLEPYCLELIPGQVTPWNNLIVGTTYYIELMLREDTTIKADFGLRVMNPPPSPVNDKCADAINLVPSSVATCSNPISGTLLNAHNEGVFGDNDVWYKFTATSGNNRVKINDLKGSKIFLGFRAALYKAATCAEVGYRAGYIPPLQDCYLQDDTLEIGKNVYIRVFPYVSTNDAIQFNICVNTVNSPSNQRCKTAIPLTVSNSTTCTKSVSGNTTNCSIDAQSSNLAILNAAPCVYDERKALFYSFAGTGKSLQATFSKFRALQANPDNYRLTYTVLEGKCGAYQLVTCGTPIDTTQQTIIPTEIGKTYFLIVTTSGCSGVDFSFDLCVTALPPPPSNDEVQGAISIPVSANLTSAGSVKIDTKFATHSQTSQSQTATRDLWYKFTATQNVHLLSLKNVHFDNEKYFHGITLRQDDATQTVLQNINFDKTDTLFVLTSLEKGKNYYISFFSNYDYGKGFSCDASLLSQPVRPNDDCSAATLVPVNQNWRCDNVVAGTTRWATVAALPDPFSNAVADVWFKFVATASQHQVTLQNFVATTNTPINTKLQVYDIQNCSIFKEVLGLNNLYGSLKVGQTYYIRLSSSLLNEESFFDVCVTTPTNITSNMTCETATSLPISVANPSVTISALTALPEYAEYEFTCGGVPDDDIWYKFTATSDQHLLEFFGIEAVNGNSTGNNFKAQVWKAANNNDCSFLVQQQPELCIYSTNDFGYFKTTPGDLYYLRFFTDADKERAKFSFTLSAPPHPSNEECSNAIALPVNPNAVPNLKTKGNLQWATPSVTDVDTVGTSNKGDVWYSFTATAVSHSIEISPNFLYDVLTSDNCQNFKRIFKSNWLKSTYAQYQIGKKYYIRIINKEFDLGCPNCNFDLAITSNPNPPSNDECSGAMTLPIETVPCALTIFSTQNATLSINTLGQPAPGFGCNWLSYDAPDVWFKFVATAPNVILVAKDSFLQISLYQDNCEGTPFLCKAQNWTTDKFPFSGLTVGKTYFLQIVDVKAKIELCLQIPPLPPSNDKLDNATVLTVNPTLQCGNKTTGTLQYALGTPSSGLDCSGQSSDVWYKFKAVSSRHFVKVFNVQNTGNNPSFNVIFNIFQKKGNELKEFSCNNLPSNNNVLELNALELDSTYYVQVAAGQFLEKNNGFDICVTTDPKFNGARPINDFCNNAIMIMPDTDWACESDTFRIASASYTNLSASAFCTNDKKDVWFKFKATDTQHLIKASSQQFGALNYLDCELFKGTDCDHLKSVWCNNNNNAQKVIVKNLVKDSVYWLRVMNSDSYNQQVFRLCLETLPSVAPSNDTYFIGQRQ
jgi:hypothetical protein